MKKAILIALLFLPFLSVGQSSESYFPINIGKQKTLTWYKDTYVESFTDSTQMDGKWYYIYSQKFKNNTIEMKIRVSNDTVYTWNDVQKNHRVFFGINPKVGETVGKGTIKEVGVTLKTPKGTLKDLLVIEMNYTKDQSDTRYYQKGLGLVAVINSRGLVCYYVPK